jgi:hypothetical protein
MLEEFVALHGVEIIRFTVDLPRVPSDVATC